jgi:hypothetical protein
MIDLVSNKLSELGYEVYWQLRPSTFPSLTFSFVNETGEVFTEDGEAETEFVMQVDVWSKNDYTDIVNQVKEKLKEIEFHRIFEHDDFEADTQIYHKILRFECLKNNESEV